MPKIKGKAPKLRHGSACSTKTARAVKTHADASDKTTDKVPATQEESDVRLKETINVIQNELHMASARVQALESENAKLKTKLSVLESQSITLNSKLFTVGNFNDDEDICFYTGFPNYQTFLSVYNFLDPGKNGENMRYCTDKKGRSVSNGLYCNNESSDEEDIYGDVEAEKLRKHV